MGDTFFSLRHTAPDGWFPLASIVWHPSEQPDVSVVAFDAAPRVEQAKRDGAEARLAKIACFVIAGACVCAAKVQ